MFKNRFVNIGDLPRRLALGSAAAVLLAACGGGSGASTSPESDESSDTVETAASEEYESPLGEFFGWSNDFSDDDEERYLAEERERQEKIAKCMAEQGFQYKPIDNSQFVSFDESDQYDGLEWGSKEWTEKFGFGISTQAFSQKSVGPNLLGHDYDQQSEEMEEFTDPNQEYIDSLDESTRTAYYAALYGNEPEIDFETASEDEINEAYENWEPDGCESSTYNDSAFDEKYEEFDEVAGDIFEDVERRIQADPRIIEENERIESCVTDAGQQYFTFDENSDGYYGYFEKKMEPLYADQESFYENYDPFEGVDFESMTEEEQEQFFAENEQSFQEPELSDAAKATLGEIQTEEIAMAVAYQECGADQFGSGGVYNDVRIEIEREILEENQALLAQFEGVFAE